MNDHSNCLPNHQLGCVPIVRPCDDTHDVNDVNDQNDPEYQRFLRAMGAQEEKTMTHVAVTCTNRRCKQVTNIFKGQIFLPRYCIRCGRPLDFPAEARALTER